METYQQGKDNTLANGGSNCLTCHGSNTTNVSHVFGALKPLF
jgi:mono/diheme cytochrome c family protein